MTADSSRSLTELLAAWREGDGRALDAALQTALTELQSMAAQRMHRNADLTLTPAELLNEAMIHVMQSGKHFNNRAHFYATMSLHMRTVLVDYARARHAGKRGGGAVHVTLTHSGLAEDTLTFELIALDEALQTLAQAEPRAAEVTHLTYFAGLEREGIAEVLKISVPTVDRDLRFARAWLAEKLGHDLA
ncbi:MAG: sigma-70 family RNA polymerase sigma factor [Betaproteobacteria bacterium]|nr:sigma-70 family RNA polymerase sigma factor [Betaproteobacteria bacterium]